MSGQSDVILTPEDYADLANIIAPGGDWSVNPDGYSADILRGIIARHLPRVIPPAERAP